MLRTAEFLDGCRSEVVRPRPLTAQDVRTLAHDPTGLALDLPAARHLCRHTRGNPRHVTRSAARTAPRHLAGQPPRTARTRPLRGGRPPSSGRLRPGRPGPGGGVRRPGGGGLAHRRRRTGWSGRPAARAGRDPRGRTADRDRRTRRALLAFTHSLVRASVRTGIDLTRRAALHGARRS
ncbi:hypothetical protein ACRAWF_18390 [Streptomyces sp. L7]